MLIAVGFIFLCLGFLTGIALVLGPLGIWALNPALSTYILFALLTGIGYLLVAVGSRAEAVPLVTQLIGAMLLLLAAGAAIGLVLISIEVVTAHGHTRSLWFVFVFGGLIGTALLTAYRSVAVR